MTEVLDSIEEAIFNSKTIYIASHVNPDGDNLGSSLALYKALKNIGKDVYILYVDKIPENYRFLPLIDSVVRESDIGADDYLFIALDSADVERLGRNKNIAKNAECLINIDHHISNPNYGDINFVDSGASATGELIYRLIKHMELKIDSDIATNLYTAISSDTGSFMYSNTTARTHEIISELYDYDIDIDKINVELYQSRSLNKTRMFIQAMMDMELYCSNKVALVEVTQELLKNTNTKLDDTEGLVENLRDIKEVELAVLIKEESKDIVKVSTRSKGKIDVSYLCSKFNGGGHRRAAGCTIYKNKEEAKKDLLREIELII